MPSREITPPTRQAAATARRAAAEPPQVDLDSLTPAARSMVEALLAEREAVARAQDHGPRVAAIDASIAWHAGR